MRAIGIERFEFITKATYAYEHLKQEIIDGALAPGEKLVVNSISKRYHMSAMPVREALLRLEQDGLVQSSPHRGACVHRCDYNQFYELIQVSVALETMACRLAAVLIDDGAMAQLEGFLRGMESAAQCGDISTYLVLNEEFHMGIYRASGNKELFELIHTTHRRTYPYTSIALHTRGRVAHSMEEHRDWLEALRRRDQEKCAAMCRAQRLESYHLFLDFLEECLSHPEDAQSRYYLYSYSDAFSGMDTEAIRASIQAYREKMKAI